MKTSRNDAPIASDMLTFNTDDFERAAERWGFAADQIPFAASQALNDASKVAREELISCTWPEHVEVRSVGFIRASLQTEFATKRNLRVAIVDQLDRGNLKLHAEGGTRRPIKSSLAIPSAALEARRTSKGVPKNLRPLRLPNTFKKGDVLYQRTGSYKKGSKGQKGTDNRGLKLMYTLKRSAQIKAAVPFQDDFERVMTKAVWPAFQTRMAAAMTTRHA